MQALAASCWTTLTTYLFAVMTFAMQLARPAVICFASDLAVKEFAQLR